LLQYPFAKRGDDAGLFGDRNEFRRGDQPAFRMFPAQQSLVAANITGLRLEYGLIVDLHLAPFQGFAKVALKGFTGFQISVHLRLEEPDETFAVCFRLIQSNVGVLQQLVRICCITGMDRDTEADADSDLPPLDHVRRR
jgi:hypothetical protein